MEAEARYTWVGAVVLLLLAALLASLVWLHKIGRVGDFKAYTIHFEQQALDGLQVGADVSLRGVKVGRVEDYALDDSKLNRVNVTVRVSKRAPVHENTSAIVTRNFVTGIASITLVTPAPPGPLLSSAPAGEAYPVIAEGRSDLETITGRVTQIGDIAAQALERFNDLLSGENVRSASEALRNLRDISAGLSRRLAALDRTLAQVGGAAQAVGQAATSLADSGQRIAVVAERGGAQLEPVLAQAQAALAETRGAVDRLSRQTSHTAARLEASADNADAQLAVALSDLRLTLDSAARLMDQLRQPRSALLGPPPGLLGPGELRP